MNSEYEELLDRPHFHAPGRPYMKNTNRAAQFSSYKSLDGYYDMIEEAEMELAEDFD